VPAPEKSVVHGSKAPPGKLPSVDRLLRQDAARRLVDRHGHSLVAREIRALLDGLRARATAGELAEDALSDAALGAELEARCARRLAPNMRAVLNLTGTVIHTNLGRALLAEPALAHLLATMAGPNNLEYDLASGGRGDRDSLVEGLLCELTGAEAATVVNAANWSRSAGRSACPT
jgi:L-seryl-tRNA(Ser) seleniumtransferase